MKSRIWLAAAAWTLLTFGVAAAQDSEETETAFLDPSVPGISADELETFADIYADLEETSTKYEMALAEVTSEREARDLHTQMQRETQQKIERHGWTEEKYEEVSNTVNSSRVLLERALALIDERSGR